MRKFYNSALGYLLAFAVVLFTSGILFAQVVAVPIQMPECTVNVPGYQIDLSANPNLTFTTPEVMRQPTCCSDGDRYLAFYVTLHPDVAMIQIEVAPGYADPGGSGNYQIVTGGDLITPGTCGAQQSAGQPLCITGPGPHKILYSKPGNNKIKYIFRQITKPIFPLSQPTRVGCTLPLPIYGLNNVSISATSKSANCVASLATCNTYMSCLNCANPVFSPGANDHPSLADYPYSITYSVTGTQQALVACGSFPQTGSFTVTVYDALHMTVTPNPAAFCAGGSGVDLNAAVTGGLAPYNYVWLNSVGDTVSTASLYHATAEDTYTAHLTDALITATCPSEDVNVPVIIGSLPVVNAGADVTVCATSPAVLLQGTSSTGSGVWTGGLGTYNPGPSSVVASYTPTAGEISAGSVTLTLTSTQTDPGCSNASDQMTLFFSPAVSAAPTALPISCYNGSTVINAGASGGTPGYTYSWSDGTTGSSITATAGTYSVTVYDQYGCSDNTPITVSQPSPLDINLTNTFDNGTCDGSATAAVSGGTGPYAYSWSPGGQTTASIAGQCAGVYTVSVTDNNGCSISQSVVINDDVTCQTLSISVPTHMDVDCYNGANGTATAAISGGTAAYSYLWSPGGQTGITATGLTSGTYTVMVTDFNGCTDYASVSIMQPTGITNTMTHTDVTTIGGTNGTATANPLGGTPGYSYLWSPGGQTTQTATSLSSGAGGVMYYVDITDSKACLKEDSVLINQPPCNNFVLSVNPTNITCNGYSNGSAYIVIVNGTGPFSIVWSHGPTNVTSVSGLAAGNYTVTVTDASNCTTFQTFSITEPNAISLGLVPTNITCNGDQDGTIDLTVSGGTYPFTYLWTIAGKVIADHEDLINIGPGTYTVTVIDANGCKAAASVGITQPVTLSTTYTYSDNPCYGNSLGSIDAATAGGTSPFTYSWSGPSGFTSTSQDITGLAVGLYTLTTTDNNGCVVQQNVNINQPDLLTASAVMTVPVTCAGGSDGAADLIVSGGTTAYTYLWSNGSTLQDPLGLSAGTYNVTVTDAHSCSAATSVTITTIIDVTNPVITCSGNKAVNTTTACTYVHSGTTWNATANDNCLVSSVAYVLTGATTSSGTNLNSVAFNLGITTVTWTATDGSGNTATCSYTVTVSDAALPVISSCGGSTQSVNVDAGQCNYTQTGTGWDPTVTDNCTVSTVLATLTGATTATGLTTLAGVDFNLGTTTVTWIATDGSGNSSTCTFNITVVDNILPTISSCGGATQTVNVDAGQCNYTQTGTGWNPTVTDNCTVSTVSATLSGATTATGLTTLAGVDFNLGATTVTWTVVDGAGNSSTCSFVITVVDNILPTISSCGGSTQTVNVDAGQCNYTQSGTGWNPTVTDNCTVSSVLATLTGATTATGLTTLAGVDFLLGTTTVTWIAMDASGNTSTCTFNITVVDNILPTITSCGPTLDVTLNVDAGQCNYTKIGTGWNAAAIDNCSITSITANLSGATSATGLTSLAGVDFNLGTTTVLWTVTDGAGNISTCTFDVIVVDNILPTISSCGGSTQSVNVDAGQCNYTQTGTGWNPTVTDNCTVSSVLATLTGATTGTGLTTLAGVDFNLGTTTVTWIATDGSGNNSICSFNITVTDNILPAISSCGASGNQSVFADAGQCNYTQTGTAWDATATDNCTVASILATLTGATTGTGLTTLSGVDFNLGTTTVLWTVRDGSGNISTCTFDVTVTDNQLPAILSCGITTSVSVNANTGLCTYTHSNNAWNASATDNCSVATLTYNLTGATSGSGNTLNGVTFNLGTTTVVWTATDGSGNVTTCSFTVTVNDNQLPVLTSCGSVGNQIVNADAAQCNFTQTTTAWNASASDNCSVASLTYTLTGATSGTGTSLQNVDFNLGTTTVTWTVVDGSGNSTSCTFQVLVIDNQLPAITSCGASGNQTVNADNGICSFMQTGNLWNAVATDNCTVSTLTYTLTGATTGSGTSLNGVTFNLGTTTVVWTAIDGSGNNSTCNFTVTVVDNQLPVISGCPSTINVGVDAGDCGAIVTWTAPAFTDNCGATMTSNHNPGEFFTVGTTNVTYTVTDGSGNVSICTFDVIVTDNELPSIACSGNIVSCDPFVTYSAPVVSDNCGVLSTVQTAGLVSGIAYQVGTTVNTFLVTDIHGNTSSCSFNVTIHPLPIASATDVDVSCNGNANGSIDLTVTNGTTAYSYDWSNGATTEDLSGLAPGTYTVDITDANGCETTASAIITEPAVLTLNGTDDHVNCFNGADGGIDVTIAGGTVPYSYNWNNGSTTQDLFGLTAGAYNVTVTDFNGCTVSYSTVIDQPDTLVIQTVIYDATCNAANGSIQTLTTGGTTPYTYSWSDGSTGMNLNNAVAGMYSFTVLDALGCTAQFIGSIGSVSNLSASSIINDVRCYGQTNGEIRIIMESGNEPYVYDWSNGASTEFIDSLSAGSYSVVVTDFFGCQTTMNFDVDQPDSLTVTLTTSSYISGSNISVYQGNDGWITTNVTGGTPVYTYEWSNGETTPDIQDLTAGAYNLVVVDQNGCTVSAAVRLSQPGVLEMPSGFSPNGDNSNDHFVIHGIEAYPDNEIVVYNRWGNVVYEFADYQNEWEGNNTKGEPLPDGTYFVIVKAYASTDQTITLKGYVDLRR